MAHAAQMHFSDLSPFFPSTNPQYSETTSLTMQASKHLSSNTPSFLGFTTTNVPTCPPPCECVDCVTSFYARSQQVQARWHYDDVLSNSAAAAILAQYTQEIFTNQASLQRSVQMSGDLILHRWRKRTQSKRIALLRTAGPHLPEKKGYIVDWEHSGGTNLSARTSLRKYLMFPYLDLDTLSKTPATLLGLLHTRVKDPPSDWVSFDHEQQRTFWALGYFRTEFNPGAVNMTGLKYGTYTPWEKEAAHRFDILGFPRGRLVIEAQAVLLSFLRKLVDLLLVGSDQADTASTGCENWNAMIERGLKLAGDSASWSTFVHRPFITPPRLDVDSLVGLVKARVSATGDQLRLLQTEPKHLKHRMRKIAQMELIQSADDRAVSLLLINTELNGAVDTHWFWRCALVEFQHLQRVRQRFADNISRGSPLPAKFDNVLGALEILLVNEINKRSLQLLGLISQQPGFRHLYHHDVARPGPNGTFTSSVRMKPFIPPSGDLSKQAKDAYAYRTEKIWVILTELLGEADFQERFRYDTMLDVLGDYLATCTRDERAILGENLYEALSEYIVLVELLWTIRVHWPRNTNRTLSDCEKTEDRIAWRAKPYYHLARQTASMIAALDIFQTFRPPSGNRGHNWLKKFDLLHGNLQKYWSNVSGAYRDAYRQMGLNHEDIELAMEPLLSWNHPEYRTRLKLKREQILADMNKPRAVGGDDTFLPLYVPSNTSETSKTVSR